MWAQRWWIQHAELTTTRLVQCVCVSEYLCVCVCVCVLKSPICESRGDGYNCNQVSTMCTSDLLRQMRIWCEILLSCLWLQKVDIYSLGVMFFEMCYKPLPTAMERVKVLSAVRQPSITLPDDFDEFELPSQVMCLGCAEFGPFAIRPHPDTGHAALVPYWQLAASDSPVLVIGGQWWSQTLSLAICFSKCVWSFIFSAPWKCPWEV